jgi:hypothetical protein
MDDDDLDANTLDKNLAQMYSDKDWWESFLPEEWHLIGWTDRRLATIANKKHPNITMEIWGEFVNDFRKRWSL